MADRSTTRDVPWHVRVGNRMLEGAETVIYVGIAALLLLTAGGLLLGAARRLPGVIGDGPGESEAVALELLDALLLVFIVVELLYAVRMTIAKRELLAEPFLLVGIIASIKEIVVLSVKAAEEVGEGSAFDNSLAEIGVLGVLVLLLGITAYMLRRKEREPGEGDDSGDPYTRDAAPEEGADEGAIEGEREDERV